MLEKLEVLLHFKKDSCLYNVRILYIVLIRSDFIQKDIQEKSLILNVEVIFCSLL